MKRNKKIIIFMLAAALLISSAVAFLTATDSKTNVIKVGNVDVVLKEDFDINKNGTIETTETFVNTIPDAVQDLVPGEKLIKKPWVENNGDNDEYVFVTVTVPKISTGIVDINGQNKDFINKFVFDLFNEADEKIVLDDNGIVVNNQWELIDQFETGDIMSVGNGNDYFETLRFLFAHDKYTYVFCYRNADTNDILEVGASTEPVFNKLKLIDKATNSLVDEVNQNTETVRVYDGVEKIADPANTDYNQYEITVNAYAIQSELMLDGVADKAQRAWEIYANQNNWTGNRGNSAAVVYMQKTGNNNPLLNNIENYRFLYYDNTNENVFIQLPEYYEEPLFGEAYDGFVWRACDWNLEPIAGTPLLEPGAVITNEIGSVLRNEDLYCFAPVSVSSATVKTVSFWESVEHHEAGTTITLPSTSAIAQKFGMNYWTTVNPLTGTAGEILEPGDTVTIIDNVSFYPCTSTGVFTQAYIDYIGGVTQHQPSDAKTQYTVTFKDRDGNVIVSYTVDSGWPVYVPQIGGSDAMFHDSATNSNVWSGNIIIPDSDICYIQP